MKNLKRITTTILMMCCVTMMSFAQNDSVYLVKQIDDMDGKSYVYGNRAFIVANDVGKIGFKINTVIDDNLELSMLTVKMVGIGACNENNEIIILFQNGEKIIKTSWNKSNCDGDAYFKLDPQDITLLRNQQLSKIRITNGRTFDTYTGEVKPKDKRYFIQLLYALDNKLTTVKK